MSIFFKAMEVVSEDIFHSWASRLDPRCIEGQSVAMFLMSDPMVRRMPAWDICGLMRVLEDNHKKTCRLCVTYGGGITETPKVRVKSVAQSRHTDKRHI